MKIKVLIVDDEPLARKRIRDLIKKDSRIELSSEAKNGFEAIDVIKQNPPDLVFLDVQMPELDGFEVIEKIGVENMPFVVFVTAYDKYALQAFEVFAVDYLLKPFDNERFKKSLDRVIKQIERQKKEDFNFQIKELISDVKNKEKFIDRLVIKKEGRYHFLKVDEIDWVESAGNYLNIHVRKDSHLMRGTLSNIEKKLDPEKFIRIHRSTIVNINRIEGFQHFFNGEYKINLKNGIELTLGQKYKEKFKKAFIDSF